MTMTESMTPGTPLYLIFNIAPWNKRFRMLARKFGISEELTIKRYNVVRHSPNNGWITIRDPRTGKEYSLQGLFSLDWGETKLDVIEDAISTVVMSWSYERLERLGPIKQSLYKLYQALENEVNRDQPCNS